MTSHCSLAGTFHTPSPPFCSAQIIFEGTWGRNSKGAIALDDITFVDGACEQKPEYASVTEGDCDFTRDSCGWRKTTDGEEQQRWRMATKDRKPRELDDHTLQTPEGFIYFDAFNTKEKSRVKLRLTSPVLQPSDDSDRLLCVTFWYASLSDMASATLNVLSQPERTDGEEADPDDEQLLWSLGAEEVDEKVTWQHAEVQMDATRPTRIVFEGRATDFGFALDDISLRRAACRSE